MDLRRQNTYMSTWPKNLSNIWLVLRCSDMGCCLTFYGTRLLVQLAHISTRHPIEVRYNDYCLRCIHPHTTLIHFYIDILSQLDNKTWVVSEWLLHAVTWVVVRVAMVQECCQTWLIFPQDYLQTHNGWKGITLNIPMIQYEGAALFTLGPNFLVTSEWLQDTVAQVVGLAVVEDCCKIW